MTRGIIYPNDRGLELDGGLNTKFERSIILENESPDCLNVVFENGAVGTREGFTPKTNSGIGSLVFDGLFNRRDNTGAETMVCWANGEFRDFQTNTFVTIASAQSVWTTGVNVHGAQYEGHLFMHNGSTMPYKWNGTDFTRHGIFQPDAGSIPVATSKNAGNLNGDYQWKVSYVNSQLVESDVATAVGTVAITNGSASLTCLPIAPQSYGVNSRKIYRTEAGGTTFKLVATVSDNTTETYEDDVADADLGADAPTDNGTPPNYSVIIYFKDRLFMNDVENPNFVWYTELTNPYVVKSTNFFRMGDNTSDTVSGFGIIQNTLVVFGEESMQFVYMLDTDPNNWRFIPSQKKFGTKSPYGIVNIRNSILFPAVQEDKFIGIARISEQAGIEPSVTFLTTINSASEMESDRIESDMFLVQEAFLKNISAKAYKNKAYFSFTYGASQQTNNRIYVYDFSITNASKPQKFSWSPWTGLNAKNFVVLDGELIFSTSDSSGFAHQALDGTYNDNGSAIDSYFWTKEFGGYKADVHYHKDLKEAYLLVDLPATYNMDFNVRTDSDSGDGDSYDIALDPGGMIWGDDWGLSTWGGGFDQGESIARLNQTGKRFQFKFSNENTVNQRFKVHSFGFKYNRKGLR